MTELAVTSENFAEEVLKSPEPVLVDFWAVWCGPCRIMEPIIEQLAKDYENKTGKVRKLNVDENQDIASKYGVLSIPTFAVFYKGKVFAQTVGVHSKEALAEILEKAVKSE